MRSFLRLSLVLLLAIFWGCKTKQHTASHERNSYAERTYFVAPYKVDCMGVAPQQCLLIKHSLDAPWQLFYNTIEGFEHSSGTTYILKVKEQTLINPPADASSMTYQLVSIQDESEINQDPSLLYDIWGLMKIHGQEARKSGLFQSLEINTTTNTVLGEGGCNGFSGKIILSGNENSIRFVDLLHTELACDHWQAESNYLNALLQADTYFRFNNTLLLMSHGEIVLEFRRMD